MPHRSRGLERPERVAERLDLGVHDSFLGRVAAGRRFLEPLAGSLLELRLWGRFLSRVPLGHDLEQHPGPRPFGHLEGGGELTSQVEGAPAATDRSTHRVPSGAMIGAASVKAGLVAANVILATKSPTAWSVMSLADIGLKPPGGQPGPALPLVPDVASERRTKSVRSFGVTRIGFHPTSGPLIRRPSGSIHSTW